MRHPEPAEVEAADKEQLRVWLRDLRPTPGLSKIEIIYEHMIRLRITERYLAAGGTKREIRRRDDTVADRPASPSPAAPPDGPRLSAPP